MTWYFAFFSTFKLVGHTAHGILIASINLHILSTLVWIPFMWRFGLFSSLNLFWHTTHGIPMDFISSSSHLSTFTPTELAAQLSFLASYSNLVLWHTLTCWPTQTWLLHGWGRPHNWTATRQTGSPSFLSESETRGYPPTSNSSGPHPTPPSRPPSRPTDSRPTRTWHT